MVQAFEKEIARVSKTEWAVAYNSATNAFGGYLDIVYGPDLKGKIIVFPNLTFPSLAIQAARRGATIMIVDVDNDLDITSERPTLMPRRRVDMVVLTDYAGNIQPIPSWVDPFHTKIFRDASCSYGLPLGACHAGCYSFYANKPITCGEGGALVPGSLSESGPKHSADIFRSDRLHGVSSDAYWRGDDLRGGYDVLRLGQKANMTDIQAALGLSQSTRQKHMLDRRQRNWHMYQALLESDDHKMILPDVETTTVAAWMPVIFHDPETAEAVCETLKRTKIGFSRHYPLMSRHTAMKDFNVGYVGNSESIFDCLVSLPTHPGLRDADIARVVAAVRSVWT
jgi:dTDP-4-amino-4,6-dideoxygalactose transaminase